MNRVCVFCGSSNGSRPEYLAEAKRLGSLLAARGWGLVYGGASIGMMAAVADAVLAGGAPVLGVVPGVIREREAAHAGLTELVYVGTMHQRKTLMAERADAFLALPGGFGTLDELIEIVTWAQLGLHAKPCVVVNTLGYFDGLLAFLRHAAGQSFIREPDLARLQVASDAEAAVALLAAQLQLQMPQYRLVPAP